MSNEIIKIVSINYVKPNPYQPRKTFDDVKLKELALSIKEHGVLQPILVEEISKNNYRIIAGERRFRACKEANLKEVPIVIKTFGTLQKMEVAIIENVQREQLNPLEEAYAYSYLIQEGLTQEEVAKKIGKSRSSIANSVRLINLPEKIKTSILENKISQGHARALLSVNNPADRDYLFSQITEKHLNVRESEIYANHLNNGARAMKDFKIERLTDENINKLSKNISSDNTLLNNILNPNKDIKKEKTKPSNNIQAKINTEKLLIKEAEENLSKAFGSRVKLKGNLTCGKILINYLSYDDLERIWSICNKNPNNEKLIKDDED